MFTDNPRHHPQDASDHQNRVVTSFVAATVTALTLTVAFTLLALDISLFWIAFPIGFGVVLPTAIGLANARYAGGQETTTSAQQSDKRTGLEILRERYASGKLSEAEFEHGVERLLETEPDDDLQDFEHYDRQL